MFLATTNPSWCREYELGYRYVRGGRARMCDFVCFSGEEDLQRTSCDSCREGARALISIGKEDVGITKCSRRLNMLFFLSLTPDLRSVLPFYANNPFSWWYPRRILYHEMSISKQSLRAAIPIATQPTSSFSLAWQENRCSHDILRFVSWWKVTYENGKRCLASLDNWLSPTERCNFKDDAFVEEL